MWLAVGGVFRDAAAPVVFSDAERIKGAAIVVHACG